MSFYSNLEATAQALIQRYGKPAIIVRQGAPTGPPHNPQPGSPTTHPCVLVQTTYSLTNRNETLIRVGDKIGIISTAVDVEPTLADRIRIDGVEYAFVDLQPLNPGGRTLLYEFAARK